MLLNSKVLNNIKIDKKNEVKGINLNFGPNHPAAHGVLRLILNMDGEIVKSSDVHIGLLHRGTEKLIETKTYLLALPYFDRLDYVSMMVQEHAFCLSVEKLKKFPNFNQKVLKVRTVFDELTRVLNHLLAIACHALDVGSMSPLFWAFEEREKIMAFYEQVSGARMHAAYYRPGRTHSLMPDGLIQQVLFFSYGCQITLKEMSGTLSENSIWKKRLMHLGSYGPAEAHSWGLTGVMLRCTGVKRDVRFNKRTTYGSYFYSNNRSFVTNNGDALDRYLLRTQEMSESLLIVIKSIIKSDRLCTPEGFLNLRGLWLNFSKNQKVSMDMEAVIRHFQKWSRGYTVDKGMTTQYVESPKGEFGVTLMGDGTNKPRRCKIRSPAYNHIQFLPKLIKNRQLADLVTMIGTIDIVFGEIDR